MADAGVVGVRKPLICLLPLGPFDGVVTLLCVLKDRLSFCGETTRPVACKKIKKADVEQSPKNGQIEIPPAESVVP